MKKKYACDICGSLETNEKTEYFGYNSTYGYCDKPECKAEANDKLSADMWECAGNGDFRGFEDLCGDGDAFDFI